MDDVAEVLERTTPSSVYPLDVGVIVHRARRRVVARLTAVAAVAVVAAAALGATLIRDADDLDDGPVDVSTTLTAAPTTAPTTAPPPATTAAAGQTTDVSPVSTAPVTTAADLAGSGTGLYLPDGAAPAGWRPMYVGEWPENGLNSLGGATDRTIAVRLAPDGTKVAERLRVSVHEGDQTATQGGDPNRSVVVRGVEGSLSEGALVWQESGQTVVLDAGGPPTTLDLVSAAEALVAREDGGFDFGALPDGFEQVAVLTEQGPDTANFYIRYAAAESTANDRLPVLQVVLVEQPGQTAESIFLDAPFGIEDRFRAEVGGRTVYVNPGFTALASWDNPDGSRVDLEYTPLEGDTTSAGRVEGVLALAAALRRADAETWAQMQAEAPANLAEVMSRTYVDEQLAELGLRQAEEQPGEPALQMGRPAELVVVETSDGQPAGACEFLLRSLVTCTSGTTLEPGVITSTLAPGGYLRVAAGPGAAIVVLVGQDERQQVQAALVPVPGGDLVGYLPLRFGPAGTCLQLTDAFAVALTATATPGSAVPACPA